jgi:hypothetical protein
MSARYGNSVDATPALWTSCIAQTASIGVAASRWIYQTDQSSRGVVANVITTCGGTIAAAAGFSREVQTCSWLSNSPSSNATDTPCPPVIFASA